MNQATARKQIPRRNLPDEGAEEIVLTLSASNLDALRKKIKELVSDIDAIVAPEGRLPIDFHNEIRCFQIALVRWALDQAGGKQRLAAELLNLKPTTLNSIIKKCGLRAPKSNPNSVFQNRSLSVASSRANRPAAYKQPSSTG